MVRSEIERLAEKTAERQFLYEMETDFELAPAASRAVLETAQQVFLPSLRISDVREGQMRMTVVGDHRELCRCRPAMASRCLRRPVESKLLLEARVSSCL